MRVWGFSRAWCPVGIGEHIKTWFGIHAIPRPSIPPLPVDVLHDQRVHDARNAATVAYGTALRDMRRVEREATALAVAQTTDPSPQRVESSLDAMRDMLSRTVEKVR